MFGKHTLAVLFVLCFGFLQTSLAQAGQQQHEGKFKELQAELDNAETDTSRIRILLAMQQKAYRLPYDRTLLKATRQLFAIPLLNQESTLNLYRAHILAAFCYLKFRDWDSAYHYIMITDSLATELDDLGRIISTKQVMGMIYSAFDDLEMTEKTFLKLAELGEPYPEYHEKVVYAYNSLGNQNAVHGNLVKASRFYLKMLEISMGLERIEPRLSAALNLANVHLKLGQRDQVFQYAEEAICLAHEKKDIKRLARSHMLMANAWRLLDSIQWAKKYAFVALDYSLQIKGEYTLQAVAYKLVGLLEQDAQNYDQAIHYQKLALAPFTPARNAVIFLSDKETKALILKDLSVSYRMQHDYARAIRLLDSAILVNEEVKNSQQLAEIHRDYALTYAALGNYKQAYTHELLAVKNEKISKEIRERHLIEDSQLQYESLSKDQLITQLEAEKIKEEAKRSRSQSQRNYLVISLLFSTGLFSLFIYYLQQRRKKEQIIGHQQIELQNLKINELLNEQAAKSMSALLEGQEKERKRVAIDLHDRLGSLLAMVKLHLTEGSEMALPLLENSITEVRKISHDLASGTLDDFGLLVALTELKKTVEKSGKVVFSLNTYRVDRRFPTPIEINLYRIIQELINNSLKHAHASKISLSLTRRDDALSLVYEDNGIGFNLDKAQMASGIGLGNIQNRANQLGSELHINTQVGKGMEAILEIPLAEEKTL